jgi:hypothetical protein
MKDRNNLMTSMIVALLAGIVYYLAGADSIEKIAPQFGLIESNSQNKNDIEIVYSRADDCGNKSLEIKTEAPLKVKLKHVAKKNDALEFEVSTEEREFASSTKDVLKFGDAMELLKTETVLSKLQEVGNDLEWTSEETEEVERPAIAWTNGENSRSIKSRVKTKTSKVYSKAMAAVYLGEGDIMTGKVKLNKLNKKTNAGEEKGKTKLPKQPAPDKKSVQPELIEGNIIFIPDAKEQPEIKNDCNSNTNTNNTQGKKNKNVNINVQTSNGVSFIIVKTDDDGKTTTCKVKCNK